MWEIGGKNQIAVEVRGNNMAVLGISENHSTQIGQKRLDSGEMLLHSDHEEEKSPHTQGITRMLSKKARKAPVGWGNLMDA
ncbi:unnamed protein product [Schistosoma margrebowiei]|uniref:Uncharacterized protein n=1 Tax=Schistosoma margrebowiei TaxID=48269 RepID=A0A183LJW4_9TREM|nr:unnamed protein product [Schistosoma margrebowiei]